MRPEGAKIKQEGAIMENITTFFLLKRTDHLKSFFFL